MHPFEIFKPGRHTAMSGETLDFSAEDVAGIAASYHPEVHAAPIVVDHKGVIVLLSLNEKSRMTT